MQMQGRFKMKKLALLTIMVILTACTSKINNPTYFQGDLKYQQVMALPELKNFEVVHSPNPVYLQKGSQLDDFSYSWVYSTQVNSQQELKITEFGAFDLVGNVWVLSNYTGKPFTTLDFEDWYSCNKSIINENTKCIDSNNWSATDMVTGETSTAIWYFIGEDENGKQYRSTQKVKQIGQLKDKVFRN